MRSTWLIARTVLLEAVRRKEIYAIVLISLLLIAAVMTVNFFELEGLAKFYREVGLKIMSIATALTVVVLAARQLPREFESRTIYPLLAKPVSRFKFLLGKILGVTLAAAFCYALFLSVFVAGTYWLHGSLNFALLAQFLYLQMLLMLLLAALCFWLSLMFNLDAAITVGAIFYFTSSVITSATSYLYDTASTFGQWGLRIFTYLLPQLTLFDLTGKVVHSEAWTPLSAKVMGQLTAYGAVYIILYLMLALLWFRKKPL
jgi:ABC-type transport system involved in multi-copper enzyme maturation permease subunit